MPYILYIRDTPVAYIDREKRIIDTEVAKTIITCLPAYKIYIELEEAEVDIPPRLVGFILQSNLDDAKVAKAIARCVGATLGLDVRIQQAKLYLVEPKEETGGVAPDEEEEVALE